MFRATMCPSSGETTVSMRHLVPGCIPDSHPHRITRTKCRINKCRINKCRINKCRINKCRINKCRINKCRINKCRINKCRINKCRINTAVSPDDRQIIARNMWRVINILRINCAPGCLYLQDYAGMDSQQKIKHYHLLEIC